MPAASETSSLSPPASGQGSSQTPVEVLPPVGWLERGVAVLDGQGRVVELSDSLAAWLGLAKNHLIGLPFWPQVWSRVPEWEQSLREWFISPAAWRERQLSAKTGDRVCWYDLELASNAAGFFCCLNSTLPPPAELSEGGWDEHLGSESARREMYVRLLRAEAQLDNLVHRWPGVLFSQRADFSFQFASPSIEELTGVPVSEWRSQPQKFWQIVHEADGDELQQHVKRCVQQPRTLATTFRIRHARTGRVAYLLEHRQALLTPSGLVLGYEGVWLDITRQTIAEMRLSSAAWKETLAVLTMGLAHDFSNIMAGILSLSESFLAQVDETHPFREGLGLIKQNSLQAHQLVHRIINLHHGKVGTSHYCDLNELLSDIVDLVKKILPRRIRVQTEPAQEPLPLYVDSVEFRQVIINLVLNAAEAMPQGGQLILRTARHEQLPEMPHMRGVVPRVPVVTLSVQDTGCGIKSRHLASIFDPFFTTKPLNKGSGLGLYNTRLFVEKHRGAVSVESSEGQGSTFSLWLPQADFTETERSLGQEGRRRRSVLLVGPSDGTVQSTAEFLRCHGYHVVVAASPADALDRLEAGDCQFSALMLVMEPEDVALGNLISQVRQKRLPLKTVLQVVGRHPDEMETSLLQQTDLLISHDLPENEILARLNETLPEPAYEPLPTL